MISRDTKSFILRMLLAGKGAMTDDVVKSGVRAAFPGVAFTDGDLTLQLRDLETARLITGSRDEVIGVVWGLTPTGKLKAEQLS